MMKKVDLFKADRAMSTRVEDFMSKKVWGITLKERCKVEIKSKEESIQKKAKLIGSVMGEQAQVEIAQLNVDIEELQTKLTEQLEKEAKFEYTEQDNILYKSYKDAGDNSAIVEAICVWFNNYKLDVKDSVLLASIMDAISGERKANAKTIINSGATQFTINKRTKADIMAVFYGKLAEAMLAAGTLKATAIDEDIRDIFAPKKKDKKSSKKSDK